MSIRTEPLEQASIKLPSSLLRIIDNQARANLRTRSDVIRAMLLAHLRSLGVVERAMHEIAT